VIGHVWTAVLIGQLLAAVAEIRIQIFFHVEVCSAVAEFCVCCGIIFVYLKNMGILALHMSFNVYSWASGAH